MLFEKVWSVSERARERGKMSSFDCPLYNTFQSFPPLSLPLSVILYIAISRLEDSRPPSFAEHFRILLSPKKVIDLCATPL